MLEIKAALQIQKPVHDVFQAIVDPVKMCNYFISESTGYLEEGKIIKWKFPEFEMELSVKVLKIEKDKFISFDWGTQETPLIVAISLEEKEESTIVRITEKEKPNNEEGINWLRGNTEGWANFLACLKAYLEYGINLRKGAFDFMSTKKSSIKN